MREVDIAIFRFLNGLHAEWMDPIMVTLSSKGFWIPGYLLIAFLIWKKWDWKELVIFGLVVGAMVILADQIASGILKPWVAQYRPCRPEAGLEFVVHTVNGKCGGKYGFASSHAANFFTMATLFSFKFPPKPWPVAFFLLAIIAAYSRIYLGVHYPGDILAGAIIGLMCGRLGIWLFTTIKRRRTEKSQSLE